MPSPPRYLMNTCRRTLSPSVAVCALSRRIPRWYLSEMSVIFSRSQYHNRSCRIAIKQAVIQRRTRLAGNYHHRKVEVQINCRVRPLSAPFIRHIIFRQYFIRLDCPPSSHTHESVLARYERWEDAFGSSNFFRVVGCLLLSRSRMVAPPVFRHVHPEGWALKDVRLHSLQARSVSRQLPASSAPAWHSQP